jgi:tryptophan synthase beta chain
MSHLIRLKLMEPRAYDQVETFKAGVKFARTEGFVPAPETNHAIAAVVDEAKRAKEEGKKKVILFNLSGHGLLDLSSYDAYFAGRLEPYELPEEEIKRALKAINGFPKPA